MIKKLREVRETNGLELEQEETEPDHNEEGCYGEFRDKIRDTERVFREHPDHRQRLHFVR